ncbi:hypothetical protein GCM10027266_25650 [Arenimonas alkanexedens]
MLGGVVIAAQAGDLDAAELCGWLRSIVLQRARYPDSASKARERGLCWFSEREAERNRNA